MAQFDIACVVDGDRVLPLQVFNIMNHDYNHWNCGQTWRCVNWTRTFTVIVCDVIPKANAIRALNEIYWLKFIVPVPLTSVLSFSAITLEISILQQWLIVSEVLPDTRELSYWLVIEVYNFTQCTVCIRSWGLFQGTTAHTRARRALW